MEARLSILRAQRQLAVEAGMKLHIRAFQVINQVAAVALDARLNCDEFATKHSATSHYDRQARADSLRPCVPASPLPSLRPCAVVRRARVAAGGRADLLRCAPAPARPRVLAPSPTRARAEIYSTGRANLVRRPPSRRRARPG